MNRSKQSVINPAAAERQPYPGRALSPKAPPRSTYVALLRANLCAVLISVGLFGWSCPGADAPDTNSVNRFSFSPRAAFNISASFGGLTRVTAGGNRRTTPNGAPYNYDNGYVLTDASGNAGGQTWYWGYDSPSQISGNSILLSRAASAASGSVVGDNSSDVNFGAEFAYNRVLFSRGEMRYGLDAAVSYLNVRFRDSTPYPGSVSQVSDAYPFTPGTTPPQTPPAYQGTFVGPGFLLGATPSSSSSSVVGGMFSGNRKVDANLFGLRLGPSLEFPLLERLQVVVSGGVAVGVMDASVSWNETASFTSGGSLMNSGSDSNLGVVYGGYLGAHFLYDISKTWSAEAGVQYQNLGVYEHEFSGRAVQLDLSHTILVSLGVAFRF